MTHRPFLPLLSLLMLLFASGCESKENDRLATQPKPNAKAAPPVDAVDNGPLFKATFDRRIVRADIAKGDPESLDFDETLEVRTYTGYNRKNAFLRKPGDTLSYDAKNNFNPTEGTISFWFEPVNWDPDFSGDSSLVFHRHKQLVTVQFENERGAVTFTVFKHYRASRFVFLITPALNKINYQVKFDGDFMKRDRWYKADVTWGDGTMRFYIDGELQGSGNYGPPYTRIAEAGIEKGRILINPILWKGGHESYEDLTAIDDVVIRGRALSKAEIKKNYLESQGKKMPEAEMAAIRLTGLDNGDGRLDRMIAHIDLNALPDDWLTAMAAGRVVTEYALRGPLPWAEPNEPNTPEVTGKAETVFSKSVREKRPRYMLTMDGIDRPGRYEFAVTLTRDDHDEKPKTFSAAVDRPDTSWLGNDFGMEDFVPEPWTPMTVDADAGTVEVWNRTYSFDGPFIRKIESGGHSLLKEPVTLTIDTGGGERPVTFEGLRVAKKRKDHVVFEGEGAAGPVTVTWRNTVWFDGFSNIAFTVGPKDVRVKSMTLRYAMKPEFARYHTTPLYKPFEKDGNAYDWTSTHLKGFSLLWLMGRTHGLAWVPIHEGNWVYPQGHKPIRVTKRDDGSADVELHLIRKPVPMPAGATYEMGFIATPTRPLPKDFRTWAVVGRSSEHNDAVSCSWGGKGMTHFASLTPYNGPPPEPRPERRPFQTHSAMLEFGRKTGDALFPYSSPTTLADDEPVVAFFRDSWLVPGESIFTISDHRNQQYLQIPLTPTDAYRDFFANKVERYLSREDPEIGGVYYDLVFVYANTNPTVGGEFVDAFGRHIPYRYTTLGLRECLLRTIRICRKYGKRAWYHGHTVYNPAAMGLGDFWYPGENYGHQLKRNKYWYHEEMPQEVYETEYNPYQKGVGVINLPVVARIERSRQNDPDPTMAMLTRMGLNDVINSGTQCHEPTVNKMWGIRKKYKIDDAEFVRYTVNDGYRSDNDKVVASFWRKPDGAVLAFVGNLATTDQQATLTFPGFTKAHDAWEEKAMTVKDGGQVNVQIPARYFKVIYLQK